MADQKWPPDGQSLIRGSPVSPKVVHCLMRRDTLELHFLSLFPEISMRLYNA